MAQEKFVEFYENFLAKNEDAQKKLESSRDPETFVRTALQLGKENGFDFTEDDVIVTMAIAEKTAAAQGKARGRGVKIRSMTSVNAIQSGLAADTTGCCW
jgi:hypothetical protein